MMDFYKDEPRVADSAQYSCSRMASPMQRGGKLTKKLQRDIHNWGFIIERPVLVKSYPKFLDVIAKISGFVCDNSMVSNL